MIIVLTCHLNYQWPNIFAFAYLSYICCVYSSGTDDNSVRIYDVKTFQCYTTPPTTADLHRGGITQVRYSSTGALFATSSADGSVKVWDGVSGKCVRSIESAHAGAPVSSVRVSRNGKYVLSAGRDSFIRLWDVGSGRELVRYEGAMHSRESLQVCYESKSGTGV